MVSRALKIPEPALQAGAAERPVVESRVDGDWTFYRPRLTMMVVSFDLDRDEWQAVTGWTLDLEEI